MRLPDDLTQVKKYYLARQSKLADLDQDVEVYLDKTGKLTLADEWTDKIADWGDSAYGNRDFGLNTVALDPSRFEGLGGRRECGILFEKEYGRLVFGVRILAALGKRRGRNFRVRLFRYGV